mmetsp:Transcript_26085/g.36026  ORF Transcript_26085/g.36026 Transcript_26085/m.36026 type:complete len:90 (+) Transcript_26085:301-570(+)
MEAEKGRLAQADQELAELTLLAAEREEQVHILRTQLDVLHVEDSKVRACMEELPHLQAAKLTLDLRLRVQVRLLSLIHAHPLSETRKIM